jgi:hypothetical protein
VLDGRFQNGALDLQLTDIEGAHARSTSSTHATRDENGRAHGARRKAQALQRIRKVLRGSFISGSSRTKY